MRQALLLGPKQFEIKEGSVSAPGPKEVLIDVDLVGVCATDVHIYDGDFPKAAFPLVIGHEFTGIVSSIGDEVKGLAAGDRIAIDPAIPCSECRYCKQQRKNLCLNRQAYGINRPGGMASQVVVRAENCYRYTNEIPAAAAVLTEPLACVVHAFDRVGAISGLSVLILGAGAIGLLATQLSQIRGAASVSQIDLDPKRISVAKKLGATDVALSITDLQEQEWDLVVDATGSAIAISQGLGVLSRGGTFLQIGVSEPGARVEIAPYDIFARELRIIGSLTTEGNFPEAVELIQSGQVRPQHIVGDALPLESLETALKNPKSAESPKVVISPR